MGSPLCIAGMVYGILAGRAGGGLGQIKRQHKSVVFFLYLVSFSMGGKETLHDIKGGAFILLLSGGKIKIKENHCLNLALPDCTASSRPFLSKEASAAYATHRKRE